VIIRPFENGDLEAIKQMHAKQNFAYAFPDVSNPTFLCKKVLENGNAKPEMAAMIHLTGEAYLLVDPELDISPRDRWAQFVALHEQVRRDAWNIGLEDIHCWLPPQVEKSFGKRLMSLGWKRPLWTDYMYELREGG